MLRFVHIAAFDRVHVDIIQLFTHHCFAENHPHDSLPAKTDIRGQSCGLSWQNAIVPEAFAPSVSPESRSTALRYTI